MAPWIIFDEFNYAEKVVYEKPLRKNLRENQEFLEISIQHAGEIEEVLAIPQAIQRYTIEYNQKYTCY